MNRTLPLLASLLLLATVLPVPAAVAGTNPTDGVTILFHGENVDEQEDQVVVRPTDGSYTFTVEAYTDTGDPFPFTTLSFGLGHLAALDGSTDAPRPNDIPGFLASQITATNDGDHTATVDVPVQATAQGRTYPATGLAPYVTLLANATGASLEDSDGNVPWAVYSLDARAKAATGDWTGADAADRTSVPVMVPDDALPPIVTRGQPLLNPTFQADDEATLPGWSLHATDGEPRSTWDHTLSIDGSNLQVHVDPADVRGDGELRLLQHLAPAEPHDGTTLPSWTDPSALTTNLKLAEGDWAQVLLEVAFGQGADPTGLAQQEFTLTDDSGWVTLQMDVPSHCIDGTCAGEPVSSVGIGITSTSSSHGPTLEVNEAFLKDAIPGIVQLRSNPQDDHAVYIDPHGNTPTARGSPALGTIQTVGGDRYLFDVSAENLTSGNLAPSEALARGDLQVGRYDARALQDPQVWNHRADDEGENPNHASNVASADGTIVLAGSTHRAATGHDWMVQGLDADTGEVLWTDGYNDPVDGNDKPTEVVMSRDGSTAYVLGYTEQPGTYLDVTVRAYDADTGTLLWHRDWNNQFESPGGEDPEEALLSPDGSTLYVRAWSYDVDSGGLHSTVVALDTSTGDATWSWIDDKDSGGLEVSTDGSTVYTLLEEDIPGDGSWYPEYSLVALDATTGTEMNRTHVVIPDESSSMLPTGLDLGPDGKVLYGTGWAQDAISTVSSFATFALDVGTNQVLWKAVTSGSYDKEPLGVQAGPHGEHVYVVGNTGQSPNPHDEVLTIAYNASTGAPEWDRRFQGPSGQVQGPLGYEYGLSTLDLVSFDEVRDFLVTQEGDQVVLTVGTYETATTPKGRITTISYNADDGSTRWRTLYDDSPLGWDDPGALTVAGSPAKVVLVGSTDPMRGQTGFTYSNLANRDIIAAAYPLSTGGLDGFAFSHAIYPAAGGNGAVAVVNAAQVPAGTSTNVWFGAPVGPGNNTTLPLSAPPAAGYHSQLKDTFRGTQQADALDLAATPVAFTGQPAGTLQGSFDILSVTRTDNTTLVEVTGDAPYLERATVDVRAGDTWITNRTAPLGDERTQTLQFDLVLPETDARVQVRDGELHTGDVIEYGPPSIGPISVNAPVDLANLTDGHEVTLDPVTLVDQDLSPCVTSATWTITDGATTETLPVPDGDGDGCLTHADAQRTYTFPDSGDWTVELTATDDEAHTATDNLTVTGVANAAPRFDAPRLDVTGSGVLSEDPLTPTWTVHAGLELTLASDATDPSRNGVLTGNVRVQAQDVLLPQDDGSYATGDLDTNLTLDSAGTAAFTPPSPGTYNLTVTWTDDDAATISTEGTLVADDPVVEVTTATHQAELDGTLAGTDPLAGETLSTTVSVLFAGDRPEDGAGLQLLDPSGSPLAVNTTPTVTDVTGDGAATVLTYTLQHTVTAPGDHIVNLTGSTLTGIDLATVHRSTVPVSPNQAPTVRLFPSLETAGDGRVYMESTDTLTVTAAVTDPDCTASGPRCDLHRSWSLGSEATLQDGTAVVEAPAPHADATGTTITLTATDHLGDVTTTPLTYIVDDHLTVSNVQVLEASGTVDGPDGDPVHVVPNPAALTEGFTLNLTAASDKGTLVDGQALWSTSYSPHPTAASMGAAATTHGNTVATAFTNGNVELHIDPAFLGTANGPGLYTVELILSTDPGRIDRPDVGGSEESLTLEVPVWLGPWADLDGEVVVS